jgi:hypothetical protein
MLLVVLVVFAEIVMFRVFLLVLFALLIFLLLFLFPLLRTLLALFFILAASAFADIVAVPKMGAYRVLGDLDRFSFLAFPPRLVADLYAVAAFDLGTTVILGANASADRCFRTAAGSRPVAIVFATAFHACLTPAAIVVVVTLSVVVVILLATAVVALIATPALVVVPAFLGVVVIVVVFFTTAVVALIAAPAIVVVTAFVRLAAVAALALFMFRSGVNDVQNVLDRGSRAAASRLAAIAVVGEGGGSQGK